MVAASAFPANLSAALSESTCEYSSSHSIDPIAVCKAQKTEEEEEARPPFDRRLRSRQIPIPLSSLCNFQATFVSMMMLYPHSFKLPRARHITVVLI